MSNTFATLLGGALALASIGTLNFISAHGPAATPVAWDQPPYPTPGPRDGVRPKAMESEIRLLAWDQPPYPTPGPGDRI